MVALNAYPALSGRCDVPRLGGAEIQQVMIARALVNAGVCVSFICMDHGQGQEVNIDGIRVLSAFKPNSGVRGFRFFYPRLTDLRRAMTRADADIYYQRCAGGVTGIVGHWCTSARRPWIYASASNLDFQPGPPNIPVTHERWLYRRGVKTASKIIVQNPKQLDLLRTNYGREGVLIPSCYTAPSGALNNVMARTEVLWVGMIREVKRPDRFIELARRLPEFTFRMIGGPVSDSEKVIAYFRQIEQQALAVPNLKFMGYIPFTETEGWFDRARVVVNTSEHEGFPNTFLQAWSRGIPTVAFFDTGSRDNEAVPYTVVRCEPDMATEIERLMTDGAYYKERSEAANVFFTKVHAPSAAAGRYIEVFSSIIGES